MWPTLVYIALMLNVGAVPELALPSIGITLAAALVAVACGLAIRTLLLRAEYRLFPQSIPAVLRPGSSFTKHFPTIPPNDAGSVRARAPGILLVSA